MIGLKFERFYPVTPASEGCPKNFGQMSERSWERLSSSGPSQMIIATKTASLSGGQNLMSRTT